MSSEEVKKGEIQYKNGSSDAMASYDLLYITRAYNQKEISFEEWLKRSREWAEGIIKRYGRAD